MVGDKRDTRVWSSEHSMPYLSTLDDACAGESVNKLGVGVTAAAPSHGDAGCRRAGGDLRCGCEDAKRGQKASDNEEAKHLDGRDSIAGKH